MIEKYKDENDWAKIYPPMESKKIIVKESDVSHFFKSGLLYNYEKETFGICPECSGELYKENQESSKYGKIYSKCSTCDFSGKIKQERLHTQELFNFIRKRFEDKGNRFYTEEEAKNGERNEGGFPILKCKMCKRYSVAYETEPNGKEQICYLCYKDKIKKVYMAGKISKNDWRHNITNYKLRNKEYWEAIKMGHNKCNNFMLDNNILYTGPFFLSCDHGCSHGDATHGVGDNCREINIDKDIIFEKCLEQIGNSDYIFCWLDSMDAYGTLFELGIAREKGKKIFLAIDKKLTPEPKLICECGNDFSDRPDRFGKGCCHGVPEDSSDELWFIKQSAISNGYYKSPMEAWNAFLNLLNPNLKKEKEEFVKTLSQDELQDFELVKNKQPLSKTIIYFKRNKKIVKELKVLYDNKCQVCQNTFQKDNGENYSETHHVIPLGENGSDDVKNLVVLCPTCHKKLHYAKKEKYDIKYKEEHYKLIEKVEEKE